MEPYKQLYYNILIYRTPLKRYTTATWREGGITYGYDWILSPHWNLETLIGIGYARLWYKQRPNLPCAKCFSNKTENYFGPTKLALTVTYLF